MKWGAADLPFSDDFELRAENYSFGPEWKLDTAKDPAFCPVIVSWDLETNESLRCGRVRPCFPEHEAWIAQ